MLLHQMLSPLKTKCQNRWTREKESNTDHVYSFIDVKVSGGASNPTTAPTTNPTTNPTSAQTSTSAPHEPTSAISSTSIKEDDQSSGDKSKKGMPIGAIVGIVVGIVAVLAGAAVGVVIYIRHKRQYEHSTDGIDQIRQENPSDPI
ncbi:hypothetical protein M9Y10_006517 [Tritrichomonas musculus]|uniref:Mid2 domain-containing protein n=1 Tax=Tritrichomonas musculus TaxID=1915356 RepID=A0ABR2JED8_9EUKA